MKCTYEDTGGLCSYDQYTLPGDKTSLAKTIQHWHIPGVCFEEVRSSTLWLSCFSKRCECELLQRRTLQCTNRICIRYISCPFQDPGNVRFVIGYFQAGTRGQLPEEMIAKKGKKRYIYSHLLWNTTVSAKRKARFLHFYILICLKMGDSKEPHQQKKGRPVKKQRKDKNHL